MGCNVPRKRGRTRAVAARRLCSAACAKSSLAVSSCVMADAARGDRGPLVTTKPNSAYNKNETQKTRMVSRGEIFFLRTHSCGEGVRPGLPEARTQPGVLCELVLDRLEHRDGGPVGRKERRRILAAQRIRGAVDDRLREEAAVDPKQHCVALVNTQLKNQGHKRGGTHLFHGNAT